MGGDVLLSAFYALNFIHLHLSPACECNTLLLSPRAGILLGDVGGWVDVLARGRSWHSDRLEFCCHVAYPLFGRNPLPGKVKKLCSVTCSSGERRGSRGRLPTFTQIAQICILNVFLPCGYFCPNRSLGCKITLKYILPITVTKGKRLRPWVPEAQIIREINRSSDWHG